MNPELVERETRERISLLKIWISGLHFFAWSFFAWFFANED